MRFGIANLAFLLIVIGLVVGIHADLTDRQYRELFGRFMSQYDKTYDQADLEKRFGIFKDNVNFVLQHNNRNDTKYKVAMNQFGDMTETEYLKHAGILITPPEGSMFKENTDPRIGKFRGRGGNGTSTNDTLTVADTLDWRERGMVTPVRNQGQCGSCWAWSAGGAMESAWAITYGKLYELSPQQLLDCSGSYGNQGCSGGFMAWTFKWAAKSNGLCEASEYPYVGRVQMCKRSCKPVVRINKHYEVRSRDEDALEKAANIGPVAVAVSAASRGFQFYASGIIDKDCSQKLDHAIVLTGYGTEQGTDYWTVKNSWGDRWGEKGYARILKGKNVCGIASMASYPSIPRVGEMGVGEGGVIQDINQPTSPDAGTEPAAPGTETPPTRPQPPAGPGTKQPAQPDPSVGESLKDFGSDVVTSIRDGASRVYTSAKGAIRSWFN